ncbi:hypothetical protein [Streptomyces sp. MZ04]|uniref:hypothetical protein n=1 Tax=Streptomyces sp. MZ04 TaxID=2559236 RepID=UPI00107E9A0C|nr:hypothetical protein [Streptomyces sp. MZ04]TGB03198.1 hypothetical protein E2651_25825 [Streptomyces sp. MZ04]
MSARQWAWPEAQLKPSERVLSFLRDNGTTGTTAATVGVLLGMRTDRARLLLDGMVRRKQARRTADLYWATPETDHDQPA